MTATPCTPCAPCEDVLQAANVAVFRALELAGKRMVPRQDKATCPPVAVYERHTVLAVELVDLERLMAGAWEILAMAMPARHDLIASLDAYVREALYQGTPHTLDALRAHLSRGGLLEGGAA